MNDEKTIYSSNAQEVEDIHAQIVRLYVVVFVEALVVEAIDLSDLLALVIATQQSNVIGIARIASLWCERSIPSLQAQQ